jgi:alpha-ketoglutarate-dependent taurine dioxygenase
MTSDPWTWELNAPFGFRLTPIIIDGRRRLHELLQRAHELPALLQEHSLIIMRGGALDAAQFSALTEKLGEALPQWDVSNQHDDFPTIQVLNSHTPNIPVSKSETRDVALGELEWHMDYSWLSTPSKYTVLHCLKAGATAGQTFFAVRLLQSLPSTTHAWLSRLMAFHSLDGLLSIKGRGDGRAIEYMGAWHPVCFSGSPEETEKTLMLGRGVIQKVVSRDGIAVRLDQLEEIYSALANRDLVYAHAWTVGDVVVWDNHRLLHAAPRTKGERLLYRSCTV